MIFVFFEYLLFGLINLTIQFTLYRFQLYISTIKQIFQELWNGNSSKKPKFINSKYSQYPIISRVEKLRVIKAQ